MTSLHPQPPDLLYISSHFQQPETPDSFSTGSVGILNFNKILSFFSKFQAFVLQNSPGFHMSFSRIIYVLSVQCLLSHLMTQMALLIYLWGTGIAELPVLTSSLQVLWFLPFFHYFNFIWFISVLSTDISVKFAVVILWYCVAELIFFL